RKPNYNKENMKPKNPNLGVILFICFVIASCQNIPETAEAVQGFEKEKYLGKWYEIARLDFKYEEGLNNTSAHYSLNDDGSIKVINKGYDVEKKEWKEAEGKARFVGNDSVGMLEVSLFGPFYSGYNVIAIDENYDYALVAGKDLNYLWILSRETIIPEDIKKEYLKIAEDIGYDTSNLVWVEHDQ